MSTLSRGTCEGELDVWGVGLDRDIVGKEEDDVPTESDNRRVGEGDSEERSIWIEELLRLPEVAVGKGNGVRGNCGDCEVLTGELGNNVLYGKVLSSKVTLRAI